MISELNPINFKVSFGPTRYVLGSTIDRTDLSKPVEFNWSSDPSKYYAVAVYNIDYYVVNELIE